MGESIARIGIYADDKASPVVKSVHGLLQGLAASARSSLLTGVGLGGGVSAFNAIERAARAAFGFVGDAIQSASDLNETVNKSKVVFGGGADEIERWGKTASTTFGLSENAAIGAAATFGNLFVSLGQAPDKVAPMSKALVQLASDLASFNNIPIEDALQKLQSGIVGQERPLRELGVAISAASVDAEALRLGFTKVNGVFTEGQKVQARYNLIFAQTRTAQGDFARTSNELANSQRIMKAEWEDLSAQLGQALLPAMRDLTHVATRDLIPALKVILPVIISLAKEAVPLLAIAVGMKLNSAFQAVSKSGLGFAGVLGIVTGAVIAGTDDMKNAEAAILRHGIASKLGAAAADEFSRALIENNGDLGKATAAAEEFAQKAGPAFIDSAAKIREGMGVATKYVAEGATVIASEAGAIPHLMADELLKNQQALADAGKQLVQFMKDALSPAQVIARDTGFLTSRQLALGLASNNPLVRQKAEELKEAALAELQANATTIGQQTGKTYMKGLIAAIYAYLHELLLASEKVKNILRMTGSPPYTHSREAGEGVGKTYLAGIAKILNRADFKAPALPGVTGGGGSLAGIGFPGHSHPILMDGRLVAEAVDRHLYYQRPASGLYQRG